MQKVGLKISGFLCLAEIIDKSLLFVDRINLQSMVEYIGE